MNGVFGVIAPHPPIMVAGVGGPRAESTRESIDAMRVAARALADFDPDLVVLMSPHAPAFSDAFAIDDSAVLEGSLAQFGDPTRLSFNGEPSFAAAIADELVTHGIPTVLRSTEPRADGGHLDHGAIVPLSFLDPTARWPLVELSLSYLPYEHHRELGAAVARAAESQGLRVAFIASGDLAHRLTRDAPAGYSPLAADLDAAIVAKVRAGDLAGLIGIDQALVEAGGECGLRSFITLGGFAGDDTHTRLLSYEGPWGVGYLVALVGEAAMASADSPATPEQGAKGGMPGSEESSVVRLARSTIETYVRQGIVQDPEPLSDDELPETAGCFVSLHREGELRGCIGTILPTQDSLAEEVVHNAVQAAVHDPRFPPLHPDELADLDIKVDVLRAPESCTLEELDPAHYGVIVTSGWKRGLLLPDLEGVDDVATQVGIAMRKAGISPTDRCDLERFKVDRYS